MRNDLTPNSMGTGAALTDIVNGTEYKAME